MKLTIATSLLLEKLRAARDKENAAYLEEARRATHSDEVGTKEVRDRAAAFVKAYDAGKKFEPGSGWCDYYARYPSLPRPARTEPKTSTRFDAAINLLTLSGDATVTVDTDRDKWGLGAIFKDALS